MEKDLNEEEQYFHYVHHELPMCMCCGVNPVTDVYAFGELECYELPTCDECKN